MEFGQPSTGAPAAAIAARTSVLDADGMGYWESPPLKARIAATTPRPTASRSSPSRSSSPAAPRRPWCWRCPATFEPGDAVAMARPGYVAYRNTLKALHMVPVEIACGAAERFQLTAAAIARARSGAGRADPRQPRQSHRHDHPGRRAGGDRRGLPATRHPHRLRRDLSRPQLRRAGPLDAGVRAGRPRRQQLLQVLQHGRLAAGLAGRAARPDRCGRAPAWATCS